MALTPCPDCHKDVSDQARTCPFCGCPVAVTLQRRREEEEARQEEERRAAIARHRAKEREITISVVIIVAIIVIGTILYNSSHELLVLPYNTESVIPGDHAFSASGTLTLDYSCEVNADQSATVDFSLVDMHTKQVVWHKTLVCSQQGTSATDQVTVPSSSYDLGTQVHGHADWSMKITKS